jgi:preprotein translocase subunit SecE
MVGTTADDFSSRKDLRQHMAKAIALADNNDDRFSRLKSRPRELLDFLKDVRSEMRKVVAPTWTEVRATTTIVIVTVFIFAAYFALVDFVVGQGVTKFIYHFTHNQKPAAAPDKDHAAQTAPHRCTKKAHRPWR